MFLDRDPRHHPARMELELVAAGRCEHDNTLMRLAYLCLPLPAICISFQAAGSFLPKLNQIQLLYLEQVCVAVIANTYIIPIIRQATIQIRTCPDLAFLPRGCETPLRCVVALWQFSLLVFTCAGWYILISATSGSRASTLCRTITCRTHIPEN